MFQKLADLGLLGWNGTGDIGGYTTYTSEGGKLVVFPRSPPLNPPTPAQEAQRDKFRELATWWRACPDAYKAGVQHMANKTGAYYTGYNIVACVALRGLWTEWETLCRQSSLEMDPPPDLTGA